MTDPRRPDPLATLWKEQPMASTTFSPADLETRSRRLDRRVRWRNAVEYGACALVLAFSLIAGISALRAGVGTLPDVLNVVGLFALGAGSLAVALLLYFKTDPGRTAEAARPTLDRLRARLVRQRDALRTVWLWYVMPFVPGFVLIYAAAFASGPARVWPVATGALVTLALAVGITLLNRRAAARLSEDIAALDAKARP